jgi:protein-tyrosine phosphatase
VQVPGDQTSDAPFIILLVCTGNICRSALAERLGRAYLDDALDENAGAVRIVSAGAQAVVGAAMHPHSALVLHGYGAEAGDFRAQQLTQQLAVEADLTLAMTRAHRREVLQLAPRALARTFTIREAAGALALVESGAAEGATFGERARRLVAAMADARSRRPAGEDDVPDPIGLPIEAHAEAAELIADALLPLLARLAALARNPTDEPPGSEPGRDAGSGQAVSRLRSAAQALRTMSVRSRFAVHPSSRAIRPTRPTTRAGSPGRRSTAS